MGRKRTVSQFLRELVSFKADGAVGPNSEEVESILLGSRNAMRAASNPATMIQKARTP